MEIKEDSNAVLYRQRYISLDYLRVIAIISVLLVHSTETIYTFDLESVKSLSYESSFFQLLCHAFGRMFGAPVFLMISGFLLLGKFYDDNGIYRFWKKNWMHLILCTMFWFFIYDIFLIYWEGAALTVSNVVKDVLFLHNVGFGFGHVWYMHMIIGFYMLIPFVSNGIINIKDRRVFAVPLIAVFSFYSIILLINICLGIWGRSWLEPQILQGFSGGIYGLYIIMGYILRQEMNTRKIKKTQEIALIISALCAVVGSVWFVKWTILNNNAYFLWYDFPFVILGSISFFAVMMYFQPRISFINKMVVWLSRYSFAVYL